MSINHMHSDKIKLRRFAQQLYLAGDVKRSGNLDNLMNIDQYRGRRCPR